MEQTTATGDPKNGARDDALPLFNDDGEELVWYFSYGSNMNPSVFETRRKIKCLDHRVCFVPGYVLTYAEGIFPYSEPAFCTCLEREKLPEGTEGKDRRPDIHGVAFLITKKQYEHVLLTEGGWGWQEYREHPYWNIGHYGEKEIECFEIEPCVGNNDNNNDHKNNETNDDKHPTKKERRGFRALTLVGLFGVTQRCDCNASKRYCDLVNKGAEASGLPLFYREYLRRCHPAFVPKTGCLRSTVASWVYTAMFLPCLLTEFATLFFCIQWNERKIQDTKKRQQEKETENDSPSARATTTTTSQTTTTTPSPTPRKRTPRFEDVVRPPWIIMKLGYLYRIYVLEIAIYTVLFEWCAVPNGFKNDAGSTNNAAASVTLDCNGSAAGGTDASKQ